VTLPPLLVLTDRTRCRADLLSTVELLVAVGARAIVLREKDLAVSERARLADAVRAIVEPAAGLLVVAGNHGTRPGGPGVPAVHLAAREPVPAPRPALVGRSCHDAAEVARAAAEGCDYVTLSPVASSASKPDHGPALGRYRFAELTQRAGDAHDRRPAVYALGGVTPDNAGDWLAAGADGVAVMGAVMRADNPGAVVEELLHALSVAA
jgi:thiamine monophosphate synthase